MKAVKRQQEWMLPERFLQNKVCGQVELFNMDIY